MNCPNCSGFNNDGATFCSKCGYCLNTSAVMHTSAPASGRFDGDFGAPLWQGAQPTWQRTSVQPNMTDYGMGWYKFLINFAIIASGVLNIIIGLLWLTGARYSLSDTRLSAELIYSLLPSLQSLDIVFGLIIIGVGVMCFIARQKLAHFLHGGPGFYLTTLAIIFVVNLLYPAIASGIVGDSLFDASSIATILTNIVMLIINSFYFEKRKKLFIN